LFLINFKTNCVDPKNISKFHFQLPLINKPFLSKRKIQRWGKGTPEIYGGDQQRRSRKEWWKWGEKRLKFNKNE